MKGVYSNILRLLVCTASALAAHTLSAASLTVAWDPSPDSGIVRYNVAYAEVGSSATAKLDAGNSTSSTITGLTAGKSYVIYATAVSSTGMESVPSESLTYLVPAPPQLSPIANQSVAAGTTLTLQLSATYTASPTASLTYSLLSGPAGATVSSSGLFTWTPTSAQAPSTSVVKVQVAVTGAPSLSSSGSFEVSVVAPVVNTAPTLTSVGGQTWSTSLMASSQVLNNGSFEQDYTGWTWSGNQQIVSFSATEGGKAVRLNAGQKTPDALLSQTFPTTPGTSYTLSFDFGVLSPYYRSEQRLKVAVQGQNVLASDTVSTTLLTSTVVYQNKAYSFTADSSTTTLTLQDVSPTTDSIDSYLDNVKVVAKAISNPVLTTQAGTELAAQLAAKDSDVPANTLTYTLASGPVGAQVTSAGLFKWTPALADGGTTRRITVAVTDNGSPVLSDSKSFDVSVTAKANSAPSLASIANQTATVGSLCLVQFSATDPDLPSDSLTFSLATAPAGASVDPVTGKFTWIPTSAQAGANHLVTAVVRDSGSPALTDSKSFTITVPRPNTAPVLTAIPNASVKPGNLLAFTMTAVDYDVPANVLAFSLEGAPAGASVDARTGYFQWTPTLSQAGKAYSVTARVTDNGVPTLSDSQSFSIVVESQNMAPVLAAVPNQTVKEGSLMSFNLSATDDGGAAGLTYGLVTGPAGLSVSSSGLVSWTPKDDQSPNTYSVTVRVTDSGSPALSDSKTFAVTVQEVNQAPTLNAISDVRTSPGQVVMIALSASDPDVPADKLTYRMVSGPSNASVDPVTGVFTWRLSKANAAATYRVTVSVTDSAAAPLSDTKAFSIIVEKKGTSSTSGTISTKAAGYLTWVADMGDSRSVRFYSPLPSSSLSTPMVTYLEASEDLKTWVTVGQISEGEDLRDAAPSGSTLRFYRVRMEAGQDLPADQETVSQQ